LNGSSIIYESKKHKEQQVAKIVKPDLTYQWASAAGGGSVAPNSAKIQTGHIVEKPNYEYMNWLQNRQDTSIAYTFQMGVPEWDSLVEYQYHANYKSYVQRNGLIYKALQVGTNKDPATEAAYWALASDNYGSAATVQTNLNTHITNYGTLASLSNAATARSNLSVYSTTQVDSALALKALLAGSSSQLFNAANGTAGYEVVNKSQLDTGLATKAPVAGNAAQEFAVATATTGNSAVNKTQFDAKTGQATTTNLGISRAASQAEVNALTNTTEYVAPATAASAPWAAKAWVVFDATGSIKASYNVASVARNSIGDFTITFTNAMTSADYAVNTSLRTSGSSTGIVMIKNGGTLTASAFQVEVFDNTQSLSLADPHRAFISVFA
jgi:hypothetical protein